MSKHIFISHSKKDSKFVTQLVADLEEFGFRTWIDTDISGGEEWRNTIDKNLRSASDVVVVLSPNAVESRWVVHETAIAIGAGINVVPIMIKEIPEKDVPVFAEEKQWIDFLGWEEEEKYQTSLEKLKIAITPPNPIQDLLEQSVQAYLQTGELLGDSLLGYIEENLEKVHFDEVAKELFEKSRQRHDKALQVKKRNLQLQRWGIIVLSVLTVAAIILSIFSFNQTNNLRLSEATSEARAQEAEEARVLEQEQRILADEARVQAEEQASLAIAGELAANASSLVDSDPELGLILAVRSLREHYTIQAEEVLRQLLLTSRLRTMVYAHQGQQVNVVDISPDGKYILTGGQDNAVRIWNTNTSDLYKELLGHTGPVTQASFSEGGQSIITISNDHTIRVWGTTSGEELLVLDGFPAAISPDGKFIIGVDASKNVTNVWEVETHQLLRSFENTGEISNVGISPEGKYAVVVDADRNGVIWDIEIGTQVGPIEGNVIAFSQDGGRVITHLDLDNMALWDITSGEIIRKMETGGITYRLGASFSNDGKRVVTWPIDDVFYLNKIAQIRDANTGELLAILSGHTRDVLTASIDPNNNYVVTGSVDNTLRVWKFNGSSILELTGHDEDVVSVSVFPDGKRIATASSDGTMRTWDITSSKSQVVGDAVNALFGPENTLVLNSEEGNVTVYSIDRNGISELNYYENAICRDGRWVIQKKNESVQIIEASTGERIGLVENYEENLTNLTVSPNGMYLILNNQVWKLETGEHISDLISFSGYAPVVKGAGFFSPDSELIVAPDSENNLRVWDLATGKNIVKLTGHTDMIISAVFSPDGTLVATASLDGSARVWEVSSGRNVSILGDQNAEDIFAVNFSPDSKYVVVGDFNGKVRIFEARTGTLIKNFVGQNGPITSAAFSPDGKYIITTTGEFGMADNTARIWEVNTGLMLYKLDGIFTGINNANFSEDGLWAVVIDSGKARLISCEVCVPYQELIQLAEARLSILGRDLNCQEEQKYLHKDVECAIPTQNP